MAPTATDTEIAEAVQPAAEAELIDAVTDDLVVEELLVEEISIDGMCGVY